MCKRLRVGHLVDNRYRSDGGSTARTAQAIKKIWEKICKNPQQSARKMTEKSGLSQTTTRRILREDLCLYSYKKRRGQCLTNSQIQKRLTRRQELKNWHPKIDLDKVFSHFKHTEKESLKCALT